MKERTLNLSEEFPKRFKQLRQNRNWSQGQVALKIGTDARRISQYERGAFGPNTEMLLKIATVFEVSIDYLLANESGPSINIKNQELLKKVEEVDQLSEKEQRSVIDFLDAYIKRHQFEALIQR